MVSIRSIKKFCKGDYTKIENYEEALADDFKNWDIHHRLELTIDGDFAHSREELKRLDMYYNRPYFELIFLSHAEHARLHMTGKKKSAEHRKKISIARQGKARDANTRKKISESLKGSQLSVETRHKITDGMKAYWQRRRQSINKLLREV